MADTGNNGGKGATSGPGGGTPPKGPGGYPSMKPNKPSGGGRTQGPRK